VQVVTVLKKSIESPLKNGLLVLQTGAGDKKRCHCLLPFCIAALKAASSKHASFSGSRFVEQLVPSCLPLPLKLELTTFVVHVSLPVALSLSLST
jgi:hypothetical protein